MDLNDYEPPVSPLGKIVGLEGVWTEQPPAWVAAALRGEAHAAEELTKRPVDDGTVWVSTVDARTYERTWFRLCRWCNWGRESSKCQCGTPAEG